MIYAIVLSMVPEEARREIEEIRDNVAHAFALRDPFGDVGAGAIGVGLATILVWCAREIVKTRRTVAARGTP